MRNEDKITIGLMAAFWAYVAARIYADRKYLFGTNGVGAVKEKRRLFREIADAQKAGVPFGMKYDRLTDEEKAQLKRQVQRNKFTGSSRSGKPVDEQYYNSLNRAYNAVAGTNLPYTTSKVYNENGDQIIEYRDYGTPEQRKRDALNWFSEFTDPYSQAVSYIAGGGKFVWSAGKNKNRRGIKETVFFTRSHANEERKSRVSYLSKHGKTPEELAESLWQSISNDDGEQYTDQEILEGINQAILDFYSVGQAQKYILDMYSDAHRIPEEEDVFSMQFDELSQPENGDPF